MSPYSVRRLRLGSLLLRLLLLLSLLLQMLCHRTTATPCGRLPLRTKKYQMLPLWREISLKKKQGSDSLKWIVHRKQHACGKKPRSVLEAARSNWWPSEEM